jgi:hypothetical protein
MPNQRQIKLELPGNSLINCFGIQPVLVSGEVPQRISLFSINRYKLTGQQTLSLNIRLIL